MTAQALSVPAPSINGAVLGAGFIGLNFIRHAIARGDSIRVLDHKPPPPDLVGRAEWIVGDFGSEADLLRTISGVETVFHFVSSTVPGDEVGVAAELRQNVFQTLQLLDMCVRLKISRVIFSSSSSVYGVQTTIPIVETAPTDPISAHGIHKLTIEKFLLLYRYQHGLDCRIVRIANPFGPGQSITGRQGFVAIAIGHLLAGDEMTIRGDGNTIRDFIYINDVCEGLRQVAVTPTSHTLFNIGSGSGHPLNDVIATMRDLTGMPLPVVYAKNRFVDIPESVLDISRARTELRLSPAMPLEEGLVRVLEYHGLRIV